MKDDIIKAELVDTIESIEVFDITDPAYRKQLAYLVEVTLDSISNPNTHRAYRTHLLKFLRWRLPLSRIGILRYIAEARLPVTSHQMALVAFRKLTLNAEADQLLSSVEARRIFSIRSPKSTPKLGRWLTIGGVQQLLSLPSKYTLLGCRDSAMFALLLGCGLRSCEAITVTWDEYREVNGRPCLVDITGKGLKCRTVPVPAWASAKLEEWKVKLLGAGLTLTGPILRSVQGFKNPLQTPLRSGACGFILSPYSRAMGIAFTPHDLRRTLAQLMRKAGVPIEQIGMTLGHSSVVTTERYLGTAIVLEEGKAGVDQVPWQY